MTLQLLTRNEQNIDIFFIVKGNSRTPVKTEIEETISDQGIM